MASKHMFLPALDEKTGSNVPEPGVTGFWSINEVGVLKQVSEALQVAEEAKTRGLSSVPDVWARPLTFQAALKQGAKHPLRKELLAEWRGLLSLLALSRLHQLDVRIVPVRLGDGPFSSALTQLAPASVQLEPSRLYSWTDVFLICYYPEQRPDDAIPIGALSPVTLVYTSASYAPRLAKYPAFFHDNGTLKPPDVMDSKEHLLGWLSGLQKRLNEHFAEDDKKGVTSDINALLSDWKKELDEEGVRPASDSPELSEACIGSEISELREFTIYSELLRPLERSAEDTGAASDILLRSTRNQSRQVVVVSAQTLGRNVKVWRMKRTTHLGTNAEEVLARHFSEASGTLIDREDLAPDNAIWVRPEAYFLTDTLLVAKPGMAFLPGADAAANKDARFVLPFKPAILEFFSPQEVRDRLKPEFRLSDEGIVFTVKLPIWDGTANETSITVRKVYKHKNPGPGEGKVREVAPPVLCLFPRYMGPEWRRYYLFQHGIEDLRATMISTNRGAKLDERERGKCLTSQVSGDDPFPEAVELVLTERSKPGAPAGFLVLERDLSYESLASQGTKIGVDFGTSNTNVFVWKEGKSRPEPWGIDLRHFIRELTATSAPTGEIMEAEFLPARAIDLPIPTNLKVLGPTKDGWPLLDYFIYFPQQYQLPSNVHADIKWTATERKTDAFLESLLFLILLDLTGSKNPPMAFSLLCSFPKVFSDNDRGVFEADWGRAQSRLLADENRVLNTKAEGSVDPSDKLRPAFKGLEFRVEGQAAGHFFAFEPNFNDIHDKAQKETAAVCLDVGGGTTDISLWYHNRIRYDSSVLLAGRQFASLLQRNSVLRELLFSKDAAVNLQERANEPSMFAACLNLILRREEEQIHENLMRHANRPEVEWLRRMLAMEFGAIVFYTAALIAAADREIQQPGDLLRQISGSNFNLHWGGNAAKLMSWIDLGKYSDTGIAATILKAVLLNALKDAQVSVRSENLGQKKSPGFKCEVAGGLVVMDLEEGFDGEASAAKSGKELDMDRLKNVEEIKGLVMGESFESAEGGRVEHSEVVTDLRLFPSSGKTLFRRPTLERFDRFLEIINFFGVRLGLFSEKTKVALSGADRALVTDRIAGEFIKAAGMPPKNRNIEPVFIAEVKILLDLLGASFQRTGR